MAKDFTIHTRIHTETLDRALKRILKDKYDRAMLTGEIQEEAARKYAEQLNHYVPSSIPGGDGNLRSALEFPRYKGTVAIHYVAENRYGEHYASAQFNAPDWWNRTNEGTFSHWSQHITPEEKEVVYRHVAKLIVEGMNNA